MKIIKIDSLIPENEVISEAILVLQKGGVVAHPTDTCYGFAVDAFNEKALKMLHKLKKSDPIKPVSLIFSKKDKVNEIAEINDLAKELIDKYWPGDLTIIMKKNKDCPKFLNFELETIGLRIPNNKVSIKLCQKFKGFLTSTSANISGKPQAYSTQEIIKQFKNQKIKPDLILDGGEIEKKLPSTVVDITGPGITIVRMGDLEVEI